MAVSPDLRISIERTAGEAFEGLAGSAVADKISSAVAAAKVVVFGRSTCPFCIEVSRTFVEMGVPFTYYMIDKMEQGGQIHEELKKLTGQKTVPYVYINGALVGGCDATKDLIASGEFDKRLGSVEGVAGGAAAKGANPLSVKLAGVDDDAPKVIGALLEFPNTVDNRVIRLVGLQIFFISLFIAIFSHQERRAWKWVSVGMLVDFCLRFYGGAGISPLGSVAQLATAVWDLVGIATKRDTGPIWGAGPPKQFAVSVGILFSTIIVVMQFTHQWQAATAFAATLCFFAGLEAFLNFCAGCLVFSYAIKFGVVPDSIYMVHINTLPETKYTWHEWTKRVHPPAPKRVVERFASFLRSGKATKIDLHYKTGKTDDWEREDFHLIKHSKIGFFTSVMGVVAIPAMFKFMWMVPSIGTPALVWQILTLLSLVYTAIFTVPYLLKMLLYPRKVHKEWMHPVMNNSFTVPFMALVVYAFLADFYSRPFAKVLFWAGAAPMLLLAVIIVGEWLSRMKHDGAVNGAFQVSPVGLYIVAVVGPIIEPGYRDVCFLWFGLASLMYITLFIWSFQKQVVGHNADPRGRMFSGIWVGAPAVGAIAWTVLTAPAPGFYAMDAVAQTLFYIGFGMGLVLVWMVWRRFLWTDKFFMQMWAFGFPIAALAWAAILYDATINTALSKVLAVCLICLACIIVTVLVLRVFAGIARLKVFIPEHRWGPMSHLPLAQESMRAMLAQLTDAADALAANPSNARLADRVASLWRSFSFVNAFYIKLKSDLCFPQVSSWFPGHTERFEAQNRRMLEMQGQIDNLLAGLSAGANGNAATVPSTPIVPASLDGFQGSTLAEQVADAAATNQLVVVGRSTCPFCIEVSRTLSEMGLPFTYFQVDHLPNGAELHAALKEATGQKTVPYVYINGQMVGGCDATKDLIASGEFDKRLGGKAAGGGKGGGDLAALQAQVHALAKYATQAFDDVEDHVRPVVRRYISMPVQRKIMNDCWDYGKPEEWFQTLPLVVQHLPMLGQRLTYIRAFLWAMPERCQQIGVMVALGVDPVNWYLIKRAIPDITPRGESGWKHF